MSKQINKISKKMEEIKEEKLIEERKKKVKKFLGNKRILFVVIGLIVLLVLAWHIRTSNVNDLKDIATGDYALGPDLDPYLFLRYAKHIVEKGSLMEHDDMRYVPLGYNTAKETRLLPYMLAYFHKAINLFSEKSVNYAGVMFPVFMFLLTAIVFFLFINKIFENKKHGKTIALISTAFLIVSPSLVSRTVAGIPEKESAAFFFMFLAFYFFLSAWKSRSLKKGIFLAFLAGISTVLMGLIWGGVQYVYVSIAFTIFLLFLFGKVRRKHFLVYSIWVVLNFLLVPLSAKFSLKDFLTSATSSGIIISVFFILAADFFIFNTKIKDYRFIRKLRGKLPDRVISITFSIIGILVLSSLFFGIYFIPKSINYFVYHLTNPYSNRLLFTVAENRQPYYTDWKNNFGPVIKGIPLFFWLFFLGSILLFYETVKNLEKKGKWLLVFSYVVFLFALIFSRRSAGSAMNGTSFLSKTVYFGGFFVFFLSIGYLLGRCYKQENLKDLGKINASYLFLFGLFFTGLIGARSAIRLIMVLSIPASAMVGFFSVIIIEKIKKMKEKNLRLILTIIAVIVVITTLYTFYSNYKTTLVSAKNMVPSSYTQQWQKAMAWVRTNTNENAVFAHWWDYGYWLQSIGNRATVLDGGNAISYWNHLLGRHVLTGHTELEALEFLYAHNASYLLIDSTEIGKYGAYSSIGSDENYDRYSNMPTFVEDESRVQETKEEIVHVYVGSMWLDQDYAIELEDKKQFLPSYKTGIGGVILKEDKDGNLKQPTVVFAYKGQQINLPLRYVYFKGTLYDFGNGYQGCLYMIPRLASGGGRNFIKDTGQALFITEKSMKALWVKLYLFNDAENFELVHKEENFVVRGLKEQGADIGDLIHYQGLQGPIKIWKINYPQDIEFKEDYLSTEYPEEIRVAKIFF